MAPAHLAVSSYPWAFVLVDSIPVGNTPLPDIVTAPGLHRLRVERNGYAPFVQDFEAGPGQRLDFTGIRLTSLPGSRAP